MRTANRWVKFSGVVVFHLALIGLYSLVAQKASLDTGKSPESGVNAFEPQSLLASPRSRTSDSTNSVARFLRFQNPSPLKRIIQSSNTLLMTVVLLFPAGKRWN